MVGPKRSGRETKGRGDTGKGRYEGFELRYPRMSILGMERLAMWSRAGYKFEGSWSCV